MTVTSRPETAESVAVIPDVPEASKIEGEPTVRVTVGGSSSSVILLVTSWVPVSEPLITEVTSMVMVSGASSCVSCTVVNVAVPVRSPALMTILFVDRVKSSVRVAVLPAFTPSMTVTFLLLAADNVAVRVLVPEASATVVVDWDKVTVGEGVTKDCTTP